MKVFISILDLKMILLTTFLYKDMLHKSGYMLLLG